MRTGSAEASKPESARTPPWPAARASRNAGRPMPTGVTTPSPVTTTRRGPDMLHLDGDGSPHGGRFRQRDDRLAGGAPPQLRLGDPDLGQDHRVDLIDEDVLVEDPQAL